jgi:hypothetical protein
MKTRRIKKNKRRTRRGGMNIGHSRKRMRPDPQEEMCDYFTSAFHECKSMASHIARSDGRVGINDAVRLTQQLMLTLLPENHNLYPNMCEQLFQSMHRAEIPCKFYFDLADVLYSDESRKLMGNATNPTMERYNDNVVKFIKESIENGFLPKELRVAIDSHEEKVKHAIELAQMSHENRK